MDLPATQAIDEEEIASTQKFATENNENDQNCLVGSLQIDNKSHIILSGITVIGRHTACKIIIDHETISKKHAEIEADSADGTIFIRDLNSTNKTKINDTKLKPNSSYQIKDGDKLCFGKVIGIFKLYHAIDDSFTSCTLQANLKNQSIIPGTPDSSVNESDVSAIAGTQADDTDKCFRRPQIPARTSTDKEQNNLKLPDFSFDDLPSPLSNNKNDYDANIYNVETQKVANKSDNTDENIYEMETQRPFNLNMNENDIENFETQKYDAISDFGMKKSADISIYSNETQKVSKSLTNDTVLNNCEASKNLTTGDISIYSVETQKVSCKKSFNQSIEDIETQRFNYKELEISKASLNVSIYSANTQKILSEEECNKFNCNESNNLKESDMSISSALTQKVEPDKLNNEFIVDSKTQKFDPTEIKSNDSIYSAATQKRISETSIVETIENLETQRFNCENVDVVEKKSTNTSIQKNISNSVINEPIDDLETQPFNKNQSDEKTLNNDISSDITVQKCISESLVNNKPLCNNSSHNINNIDSKKFENKSIHDMETQPFNKNSDEEINETSKKDEFQQNLNQDSNFTANLSLRIDNTETMSYFEENFPSNENLQDLDTHVPEEFLSSNCQTIEHKNKNNEINSFTVQNQNDSESNTAKELNKIHDFKKQEINNIHLQQENCNNIDQEDEEDDDMFCSQNLIQNCPFAFLPEESQNDDQIIITSKSFKESDNADEEKNDNINNASTNVSINSFNKNIENSLKKNQLMIVDENSGIKEKNTFLGCKFQENKNSKLDSTNIINNSKNSDDKINYSDSETDEEGIFSSHISPESDKKTSAKTNMKNTNEKSMNSENDEGVFSRNTSQINVDQNDSGTDKESVFPNHLFIDDKKSNSSINKKNSENKNNESDSATDEEGIFSNHIIDKVQSHKLYTKTTMNDSHDENNKSNLEIITNSDNKNIQEMDEIKIKNTNLLPRQVANENKLLTKLKNNITIMNDFTPSKLVNTKSFIVDDSDSENECSSPAQIVNMPKSKTNSNNKDTEFSSPTQNRNEKNPVNEVIESDDFMLAPTQKIIDAQLCVESLIPNDTIQKQLKHLDTKNNENASVENLDLEIAPTQPIDSELNVLNLHKRRLQEFEIASSRKLQKTSDSKCTDFNKIIEKNLDEMFEGPDEKSIDEDAVLLTQQLTSILETSQASDNSQVDLNSSIPSPTLSSRRNTLKLRNRRKVKSIINSNRNKSANNLNDTVERNLNEMFNNSINSMENYESDNMMTQQLKNVFESREENQMIKKNASALKKSLNVSIDTEKKKYRLSLSINKNATSTSKNLDVEQKLIKVQSNVNLKKEETIFQESSLNDESQNTEECFLNLKSKKKSNFIQDSQSDEELSSSSSKKVIYKRGTVGFSNNKKSVSTKEPVALLVSKNTSFTSDSQSDGKDLINNTLKNTCVTNGKKCLNLNLLKNVNSNSCITSKTCHDLENNKSENEKRNNEFLSDKEGNYKFQTKNKNMNPIVLVKRLKAKGTRGFSSSVDKEPVESEELVSAASTENEEDKVPDAENKVCNSIYTNMNIESNECSSKMQEIKTNDKKDEVDSDEEFLKCMPDIKVAGTTDCPPTNSQLAAASDHDDNESSVDFDIPAKWKWYAEKRYDLIYKKDNMEKLPEKKNDDIETHSHSTIKENIAAGLSVDDILAKFESTKLKKKYETISPRYKIKKESERDLSNNCNNNTNIYKRVNRARESRSLKKSNSILENSPKLEIKILKRNSEASFSKVENSTSSDSDSDITRIIPKYKPLEPNKFNRNLNTFLHEDDDDSDQEFELLRKRCEKMLAIPSTYAKAKFKNKKIDQSKKISKIIASPIKTRHKRKSALINSSAFNITRSNDNNHKQMTSKARTADEDTFIFQGSNSSSKRETRATATMTTMTNRSGLTIIRNKRSMASDSDNTQNQPPKRTKTQDDRYKLQELSPTVVTKSTLVSQKKNTIEAPKSLTGKDKTSDSSLTLENTLVDEKNQSDSKSNTHSLKTRGKATVGRKNVKETLIVENKCLSKENVLVSDSDVENVNDHSKIQNSGSKNKQNLTNLSIKEDNKIQVLNNDIENNSKRKTRGKMKNQKKNVAAKEKKESNKSVIIPNSDSEQSEDTENVINQQNQSKHAKENNKNLDSQKSNMSNKTENVNDKQTTSSQVNNVKNSDSEKSEKSEQSKPFFNKENKSRRLKTIANSNFEKSVDKSNRQENLKTSEKSKNSDSCEKLDTSEELQKSEKSIIKSRSTRIKSVKNFDTEKSEITTNKLRRNTRQNKNRDQSSDSVFSESSDYDVKKNKSVTNKNFHLQIRQTRKRTATNTNIAEPSSSEESQEIADILNNSKNKEMNSNKPHKRRKAKESNLNKSGSTHDSDNSDIPNSSIFEKPVSRAKRARLNKSTKSESMLQSSIDDQNLKLKLPQKSCTSQTRKTPSPTELSLSSLTPSRARRSVSMSPMKGSKHKVLFTGEKSEVHRKIVAKLGGTETESPAKCSILVADKVRRTFKFLCSLAQGIPIVSVKWLNDSDKVHRFLDWENYILNDPIAETKFKFKLKKSLEKAQNQKLLEGYTIFLTPQIAQPPISELKEMITSSGGKPILRAPTKWPEKTIIIAKQEDLEYIKKLALKSPKSATIHSTEFILTGILRQEVNLQEFKLSA